jgi:tetratricopeptide (TPR) repeat protein
MSQSCPATFSVGVTTRIGHRHVSLVLLVALLVAPSCLRAASGIELRCDSGAIARHLTDGNLQKALDLSVACEERNLLNINDSFARQTLKRAYLVSAQILTAQGKFDMARERIDKAKKLPDSFLVDLNDLMNTAEGFLLERSVGTAEAVEFYEKIATPYALVERSRIYLDAGRAEEALQVITDSLKLDPSSPAAHAILGEILERSDKPAALREYRRSLALAAERNPTIIALVYLELARAKRGIERLQ